MWQLELLFLYKNTSRRMSVIEAGRLLYLEPQAIQSGIEAFVNSGILVRRDNQQFEYAPSPSLSGAIDETAKMYSERRTAVINFIYASPMRSFADAFRLRPEEEE